MDRVAYIIFSKNKDVFNMIYVGESDKTEARDFFIKNDQFKCWLSYAGKEENLYLSIYPMWESSGSERSQLVRKIISKYKPVCNEVNQNSQNWLVFGNYLPYQLCSFRSTRFPHWIN